MPVDPSRTVAELVIERPSRTRVFERHGVDYCCGGKRTLAQACARRGVDASAVVAELELEAAAGTGAPDGVDWSGAPLAELCDHIVDTHHEFLRAELPRLSAMVDKVARVHGAERPEMPVVRDVFEAMRAELEAHLVDEEERLFPACRAGAPIDSGDLEGLEAEHVTVGAALERIRDLTGGHDMSAAMCNTHRATLDGLRELEADLHLHIHLENNVLFPRVVAGAA
ncbi:MAG: iron-sulfur cluster repair di-iron protein [Actinomycetota bacterium]